MKPTESNREQRLRRAAKRQGLVLTRSRRRDRHALDFDRYALGKKHPGVWTGHDVYTLTLDDVEARLFGEDDEDANRAA